MNDLYFWGLCLQQSYFFSGAVVALIDRASDL